MLYDIRDKYRAAKTLENLTGVSEKRWLREEEQNIGRIDYSREDEDIKRIIKENHGYYPKLEEIELVLTHITTSSDECQSIKDNGLLDLGKSYQLTSSDLRKFLNLNGIEILIDDCKLRYGGREYDIKYTPYPPKNEFSKEYNAWLVGRRFYFDYTICGFLSINSRDVYGGYVHIRPEVLSDIDNLLETDLQNQWIKTHDAYEISFIVPEHDCVYNGWTDNEDQERIMYYLIEAYHCICTGSKTIEILCENGIDIYPEQILECKRFKQWNIIK